MWAAVSMRSGLGSVAFDGYVSGIPRKLRRSKTAEEFRAAVAAELDSRDDATKPAQGWPWPWDDSRTTDMAYAFDGGRVWGSSFGGEWFRAGGNDPDHDKLKEHVAVFPDMSSRRRLTMGQRSGLLVIGIKGPG